MRLHSAGSLEMTLCRSWAVDLGSSTRSTTLTVISGSVAMWLISRIALATICSRSWMTTLMRKLPNQGRWARFTAASALATSHFGPVTGFRCGLGSADLNRLPPPASPTSPGSEGVPLPEVPHCVGVGCGKEFRDSRTRAAVAVRVLEVRKFERACLLDRLADSLRPLGFNMDDIPAPLAPALARSDIYDRDFQGRALDE